MTVQISLPNWLICAPNASGVLGVAHRRRATASRRSETGQGRQRQSSSEWGKFSVIIIFLKQHATIIRSLLWGAASQKGKQPDIFWLCDSVLCVKASVGGNKMETAGVFWRNIPHSAEVLVLIGSGFPQWRKWCRRFPMGLQSKLFFYFDFSLTEQVDRVDIYTAFCDEIIWNDSFLKSF